MKLKESLLAAVAFHCVFASLPSLAAAEPQGIFMAITTNVVRITNQVVVTNLVVKTNFTLTTNYYNAQGQLLTPVQTAAAPAPEVKPTPPAPSAPDPGVVRSNRVQAVRELLQLSVGAASNALGSSGAFSNNARYQIRIPEGATVFDRKKAQTLSTAMNTAAEKAVPGTVAVLRKAISELTPSDPVPILQGNSDAATRYLLAAQEADITNQVLIVVERAAADAHVQEAYNAAMLRGGGLLGAVLGTSQSVDINAHIMGGLMEAVVANMISQENLVRTDASARKSKALQEAFVK